MNKNRILYRTRVVDIDKIVDKKDLWAPPATFANQGRFNDIGTSVLYCSNDKSILEKEVPIKEDDTDKDYIKDIVYNTILSILKYHKNKMDYKTISRLYNTVYTINDMLNKGRSNIGVYPVFDHISWIIYTLYCLSMNNLTELKEAAFDIDYDDRTITIDVCNVNNIVYINNLLKNIDRSYMGIRFSIIDDTYYLDRLSKLNMDDFKSKKTIFCIVGESGSGKDTLVSYTLKEFGIPFKTVISYTDREMRENETNGVEHHFVSKDTMVDLLKNMEIAVYTKIGDTNYCTLLSDLEESDICIIDPNGLNGLKIKYRDRFNFVTVYIDCPYDERKKRLENRSDFKSSFEKRAETLFELAETNAKLKRILGISVVVALVLCLALAYFAIRTNIKVFLVQVDKTTGAPMEVNVLTKSNLKVGEKETKYFISKFILDIRTLPKDTAYYDNKLKENAFFLTQNSQKKLDAVIQETGTIQMLADKITTNVNIVSANKLTNTSNTYQVRWKEEQFSETGMEIQNTSYLGVFTVEYVNEKNEELVAKNPLGIIIKDFTISRENN